MKKNYQKKRRQTSRSEVSAAEAPGGCDGRHARGTACAGGPGRPGSERPNHVWALDFQFDQTADGRVLTLLNIVDEHTQEALGVVAASSINADATASYAD